jgi:general secretion pathway protein D
MKLRQTLTAAAIAAMLLVMTGCAGSSAYQTARDEESLGHWDLAVMNYARALELDPKNAGYKAHLARARLRASQFHFEKGKMYRASGRPDLAVVELEQAVLLDPTNDYADVELRKARDDKAKQDEEKSADTNMQRFKKKTKGVRAVTPMLEPASDRPINLNFPQPKPIKQIYRALADAAGINVVFDPQLKDDNISIVLSSIEFQKALETLLRQENHFYKIIDGKTILIAADTPQNRKTYEDLVIRTFFLSNADVTEVANALRALLQTTRISVNKAENSVTLRDTSDKVAVAERIVEQNDKQVSEVVVDVELLQINTSKLEQLGLQLEPRRVGATIPAPGGVTNLNAALGAGQFNWSQLQQIGVNSFGFTIPSATLTFVKDNTNAELLAKPQLRISEGQKAQLLIGSKVPVPVTSFNTSTNTGGNIVPVTSYQYQDVGIKIEVEPRVHHNKEVTLKLMVEVSNQEGNAPGTTQPQFGTRTISSNIRLKDGETNFLAGLYRTDKALDSKTIPFIGDIPIIGRLFTYKGDDSKTTDLVLTLTPHIIRIPDVTEEDLMPVYVGTDANISYQGTPRVENPNRDAGPFEPPAGKQPGAGRTQPPPAAQPPAQAPGMNLAPSGGPTDIFRPQPTAPPQSPREAVPPQGAKAQTGEVSLQAQAASSEVFDGTTHVLLDFDPAYVALAPGQQQSVLVRATSSPGFPGGRLRIRFDPSIAAAVIARPILGSATGMADSSVERDHVILEIPELSEVSGTRAVAEITLQGVAAGRGVLIFEPVEMPGASVTLSQAVVDVR